MKRLAAAGAAFVLTACGGAGTLPSPSIGGPGFGTDATGTVQLWVRAATQAASAPIVTAFNKSHTRVHVQLTAIPDTQYITKLATAIRGRDVPDVVDVDDINSTLLAYHEALTDITPLVNALPFKKQLSPAHLNLATYHGRIYGVPYAADISVLYYNKALFRRAGIARPPSTLDETLTDAKKITALGHGIKGISFGGNSPGIMGFTAQPSVWASKNYLFTGDLADERAHIEGNPALRKMLEFYRAVWKGGYATASSRTEAGATWGKDFLTGTVGLWPGNEGALIAQGITPKAAANIAAVPLPGALHGTCVFAGGDNIAIPRGSKNAGGAWEYIRFALQRSQQATLPKSGYTPIRSDVATPAFDKKYPRTAVALHALPHGYAPTTLAYNTAVNQVSGPFFKMFTAAVFGGGVDSALHAAQGSFERSLSQAES
jgi:multiple sugar transport system substrate-binding protein